MDDYAVFRIEGDEVEQISVWLNKERAIKHLKDCRDRHPENHYQIFMRIDA